MEILISESKEPCFEVGDLIYVNNRTNHKRIIITNMDNEYAAFDPKKCLITTNWYETIDLLLSVMSPVLLKKANQIALTEVIK